MLFFPDCNEVFLGSEALPGRITLSCSCDGKNTLHQQSYQENGYDFHELKLKYVV